MSRTIHIFMCIVSAYLLKKVWHINTVHSLTFWSKLPGKLNWLLKSASVTSPLKIVICRGHTHIYVYCQLSINPLTPNDPYRGRTAPLTSKRCILYIYWTNIVTEYFKRGIYSPLFSLQNAVCSIILTYLVPILFTFYIQGVLMLKK
jgi:hypothetical protein